jgi:tetratricopeptide (TPR) repeat protein
VAAIQAEDGTPTDYAVYPRVDYSDDADWHEVAEWGTKLFNVDPTLGPDLEHRIDAWRASGLKGQELISGALSLVQDDVRYFSASLGENSHRPKVPARTWSDRAGDCKDKTALLVAILQRLGFDAKPALVSSTARNSLRDRLPAHNAFDHAIVRLQLDGRTWWLDGTLTSQSTRLDTRALTPVDWALVVARETQALEAVKASPIDGDLVTYDHVWDTSDLSKPAHLQLTVTARDEVAEDYRAAIASGHLAELVDSITSHYRTRFQDYRQLGEPVVQDDRAENRLSAHIEGEVPLLGELHDGVLSVEVYPLRIMDSLATPDQLQRTMPWAYQPPRTLHERIHLIVPEPPHLATPLHGEVSDSHFAVTLSSSESGHERVIDWRFQRRDDVVLPADLARFRDRVKKARGDEDIVLKEPLFNNDRLRARVAEEAKAVDKDPRMLRNDTVSDQVSQAFALRVRDDLILAASGTTSPVGARVLLDRAQQDMLLGEDAAAQADLDRVAADALTEPASQYTRGLVLFTAGRFAGAEKAFRAGVDTADPVAGPTRRWIGIAAYYDGRLSDAVRSLREAVQDESGDERTITLAWLFVAAQHQDHHGEAAIASYLPEAKDKDPSWATQLLGAIRALAVEEDKDVQSGADWADRPAAQQLVATLKKEPRLVRERTVQMMFFLSQLAMKSYERGAVVAMLQLEAKLHSTSAAEDICARTALRIASRKAPADLIDSARKATATGDRRGAVEILHRAVAAAPDDTDALLMLGRLETDQIHCEALEPLTRAASLRPDDPVIGVEFARALAPCGSRARAVATLEHWLADPHTPPLARAEGLALRSMMALENNDSQLARSEDDARAALGIDAGLPVAWEAMFHVHDHQGRYQEALEDANRMKAADAPPQEVALYRGMALGQLQRDTEAEAELTSSLAVEPGNFLALEARAKERLRRDDVDGAAQDALELVRIWPNNADYWNALMQAQAARGDMKGALEAVEQKIRLQPDKGRVFAERAEVKGGLGDYKGAVEDYDHSLALDASDADVWIDRATPLWRLDRGSDAVASCLKGLALSDTPSHRSTCTVIDWQAGDHARAAQLLDVVLARKEGVQILSGTYWLNNLAMEMLSYGRMRDAAQWLKFSQKEHAWTYGAVFLYVARSLAGEEAAARAELLVRSKPAEPQWQDHLVDYAAHRIDDDALVRLSSTGAPDDLPGQSCEVAFYRGLRHWVDGDVEGGRALLASAAATCPRTFNEARIARGWLAAGPGATNASLAVSSIPQPNY